jgi:hypothetical protein
MNIFNLELMGGLGNTLFQYAFAKAFCEKNGLELHTPIWAGQVLFGIRDPGPVNGLPIYTDLTIGEWKGGDISFCGYTQMQRHLLYTRDQARKWFTFRTSLLDQLEETRPDDDYLVAHRRVGDYPSCGYVVVSKESYRVGAEKFGFDPDTIRWVTDEHRSAIAVMEHDFYRLMRAPILFRGNSTFSWWAATLGHGRVFSPIIEDAEGGKEQDVPFLDGNYARFIVADNVEDLRLKEA